MANNHHSSSEDSQESPETSAETKEATPETAEAVDEQKMLEEAQQKAEEYKNLYLRALADVKNSQHRAQLDVQNAHKYGIERLARELLLVVDSLEQGLAVNSQDEALRQGMELTLKMFLDTLDKFGIHPIDPAGQAFNPLQHEAISIQPASSAEEANKVLIVAQKGFTLNERILRPARVIVASANTQDTKMAAATSAEKDTSQQT